jgi:hypothetical protein
MDIYDIAIVNILEHELWEKRGGKVWKRARRSLQRWRERFTDWREARSTAQRKRAIRRRAEENARVETQALQRAQVKSLVSQLDENVLETLKAELYQEYREEHREILEREREKARDELAKYKATLDDEIEGELDRRFEQGRRELRDELSERLDTLKEQRDKARQQLGQAEGLLVSIVKQMLGSRRPVYLRSVGIEELDLEALNAVLAKHRLHVHAEMRYSERTVHCKIKADQWRERTTFRLESGASEPDEPEDAGAEVEASAETTVN